MRANYAQPTKDLDQRRPDCESPLALLPFTEKLQNNMKAMSSKFPPPPPTPVPKAKSASAAAGKMPPPPPPLETPLATETLPPIEGPPTTGPISLKLRAEAAEAKRTNAQRIPDGFPEAVTALFIIARSDIGPAPKHMFELIRTLGGTGFRILIASPVNPPFAFEFKKQAEHFVNIPHREFSFRALMKLRRTIKKYNVNLIHSHGRAAGVYSRLLGFLTGAAVVHTYHGIQSDSSFQGEMKLLVDRILARFKFDPVFFSSTERQRALAKGVVLESREAQIIEDAVDLKRYPKRKNANLAFGKVNPEKPETLTKIRVGAYLRPENRRSFEPFLKLAKEFSGIAQFSCAGVSRNTLSQKGAIPDSLEIVGPIADPTEWLYSLDTVVNTTLSEAPLLDSLEAMAAGCVCILSDIPPHRKLQEQNAALLFDPASPETFASALASLRKDIALREMLLGNSRYMLERFHDADTFKSKFIETYRQGIKRALGLVL
jgi:glycosyltransferase involved in cell wall biosynthesis